MSDLAQSDIIEVTPNVEQEDIVETDEPIAWFDITAVDPAGL